MCMPVYMWCAWGCVCMFTCFACACMSVCLCMCAHVCNVFLCVHLNVHVCLFVKWIFGARILNQTFFPWKFVNIITLFFWLLLWRNLGIIWFFSLYITCLSGVNVYWFFIYWSSVTLISVLLLAYSIDSLLSCWFKSFLISGEILTYIWHINIDFVRQSLLYLRSFLLLLFDLGFLFENPNLKFGFYKIVLLQYDNEFICL